MSKYEAFYLKSLNLNMETLSDTFESLCGTSRPSLETFMWNLYLGPLPFNPDVKPLLYLEPILYLEPGTFMWNLGKPGATFPAAAPKLSWKNPKLFVGCWGQKCLFQFWNHQKKLPCLSGSIAS